MIISNNLSSVGSSQHGASHSTIMGVRQPNFEKGELWTKTPQKMSDEEYRAAIADLARRDVANGKFQAKDNPEFVALNRSFVSSESPDRKSAVTNAFSLLARKLGFMRSAANNLFKFSAGGHAQFVNGVLQNAEIRDGKGNIIALYSQDGGWSNVATSAENARHHEFITMYNAEWDAQRAHMNACPKEIEAWNESVTKELAAMNSGSNIDAMGYPINQPTINIRA